MSEDRLSEKLKSIKVKGLFKRFDHEIRLDNCEETAIIIAPNGHGKTVLLRILDSIFRRQFYIFRRLYFKEIEISFQSGKFVWIYRDSESFFEKETDEENSISIKSSGFGADDDIFRPVTNLSPPDYRYLDRSLGIERVGQDLWYDYRIEQRCSTAQVIENYADQIPPQLLKNLKLPDWLVRATGSLNTHLIETQRLLHIEPPEDSPRVLRRKHMRTSSVVEKDAADLSDKIGAVLKQYANEAQKLDQSFPKRIIEGSDKAAGNESEIRQRLDDLSVKRNELVSAGLIGETGSDPIHASKSFDDPNIRRILSIYVDDTSKKLGVFDEIYEKIRLFKQIINEYFTFKNIVIDPKDGIQAVDTDTGQPIQLSELSSGEQHELVLIYELLFKVEPGSLILIDEPELSLHVAWQKRFISDIQKIQSVKRLTIIIATHSPQIINDNWDLVQELSA